jgi:hypothetical protein
MVLKRRDAGVKPLDVHVVMPFLCKGRHFVAIACPFDPAREELPSPAKNPVKQRARRDRYRAFHDPLSPVAGMLTTWFPPIGRITKQNTPDRIAQDPARPNPIDETTIAPSVIRSMSPH